MIRGLFIALMAIPISAPLVFAQHKGPNYGKEIPSGCEYDDSSFTKDKARGGWTVTWTDRFNKKHSVTAPEKGSVTVRFPVTGPSWIWFQERKGDEQQRTGFNPVVIWVEAQFYRENDYVRIEAKAYRLKGQAPDPGLWGEIKDRIEDVKKIAEVGAKTAGEAETIAKAAGLLKLKK